MLGFYHPLASIPLGFQAGREPDNTFNELLLSPTAPGQYLLEINAFKGGDVRLGARSLLGDAPLGQFALADVPYAGEGSGAEVLLRYADFHWVGDPSDSQNPNIFYEGRVSVPIAIRRAMPISPEAPRSIQREFAEIEIENTDGALDLIIQSYAVDGRRVRLLYGPKMGAYENFAVIAYVLGRAWTGNETRVRLEVRDRTYSLEKPLQTNLYGGTGGADGTAEIAEKPKPLLFGRARNIAPVLIDPTNLIYQIHDGSMRAADAVYDRGLALNLDTGVGTGGDVASYAALVSASVTSSEYATCLSAGLFKLGSSPDGLITADARGDNDSSYIDALDTIALKIIKTYAGVSPKFVADSTFASAATVGGELGFYISVNELPSTSEVLDRLFYATGAWWGTGRDGRIVAGRLSAPEDRSPIFYFDEYRVLRLEVLPSPTPRKSQRVAYRKNWTVQRGEDLAAGITDARRQLLAEPFLVTETGDPQIGVRHLEALDLPPIESFYENKTDADAVRDEKFNLHKVDRQRFEMTVKRLGFRFNRGQVIRLTYPRYQLSNGKNFVITAITENGRNDETILELWG
jgi:hypothetical protein